MESTNPAFNKAVVRVNVFRDHRQVPVLELLDVACLTYRPAAVALQSVRLRRLRRLPVRLSKLRDVMSNLCACQSLDKVVRLA